jgi:hypothetical protein
MPPTPGFPQDPHSQAEQGYGSQFATMDKTSFAQPKPFTLQPPPIKVQAATPRTEQRGFEPAPKAPGEQEYDSVPIPEAYQSPAYAPAQFGSFAAPGQAYTAEVRVESPPTSPRLPPASLKK